MATWGGWLGRTSVGTYLTVTTTVVLAVALALVFGELTAQERRRVLSARRSAAEMVTSVLATAVSAAMTFDDREGLEREIADARTTRGIVGIAVFGPDAREPIARSGEADGCVQTNGAVMLQATRMTFRHPVLDAGHQPIGAACIVFSLDEDNKALRETRRGMLLRGFIATAVIAGLLIILAHRRVVRPLERLAEAARGIERGERPRVASLGGSDELARLAEVFNSMGDAVADRERRLRGELDVAANLQLSILPRAPNAPGLEIAAKMVTATEVGGDYYDVIPLPDGCFIGIGDVSGHGLGAGIIALMIQSAVSALVREGLALGPREVACVVNRVLHENVRNRMTRRDHATLTLLRYTIDGRLTYAGAHEDILVCRAATGTVETVETEGTWVGAIASIDAVTEDLEIRLDVGDTVVLYTDGITEAFRGGEQFGPDRVRALIEEAGPRATVDAIRDGILAGARAWSGGEVADDMSVLVIRRLALHSPADRPLRTLEEP